MDGIRLDGLRKGALLATLLCALAPAASHGAQLRKKRVPTPQQHLTIGTESVGSYAPAAADARFGSSFGRFGFGNTGFRFTPSITPGGSNRRVTVAVRARSVTPQQAERNANSPANSLTNAYAYNLGVSMGWKHFAVTSDYSRVDLGVMPGSREAADVALSYAGKHWSTRLALAADRPFGDTEHLVDSERGVSVDLGGSYSISNRLDLTGGVRYKMEHDSTAFVTDDRRDSQAVYVGTAFKF